MRPVKARYEGGLLHPAKPLPLRAGEPVTIIVLREPSAARWDLERLARVSADEDELTDAGLGAWADALAHEDDG